MKKTSSKTLPTTKAAKAAAKTKVIEQPTATPSVKKKPIVAKNVVDQKKDKIKKDNIILEVKTTQTGAFKQVIERISNFISDCCIVFIPPDETITENDYYEEVEETTTKKKSLPKKSEKDSDEGDDSEEEDSGRRSKKKKTPAKKSKKDGDGDDDSEETSGKSSTKKKPTKKKVNVSEEGSIEEEIDMKSIKLPNKQQPKPAPKQTKKNTGGIRILRLTEDKSILIKLNLDAFNFEYFRCDEPKITIGVDMHNLHAHLKMVNDDDPIILYMNRDNRSAMYIRSLNGNNESSEETDMEIYLMEIGNPEMPIPQTEFQNKITMASDKFHTICKRLNNNSTHVEIRSINNEILFRGQNEGGKVTMSYKDVNYNTKKKDKPDQLVQGVYELRNLMGFSKCNKLCHTIEIYLKNDFPLVLVISVATLGKMYVFLSPIENGIN